MYRGVNDLFLSRDQGVNEILCRPVVWRRPRSGWSGWVMFDRLRKHYQIGNNLVKPPVVVLPNCWVPVLLCAAPGTNILRYPRRTVCSVSGALLLCSLVQLCHLLPWSMVISVSWWKCDRKSLTNCDPKSVWSSSGAVKRHVCRHNASAAAIAVTCLGNSSMYFVKVSMIAIMYFSPMSTGKGPIISIDSR